MATTATANRVVQDVCESKSEKMFLVCGDLARRSLQLDGMIFLPAPERLAQFGYKFASNRRFRIVYTLTMIQTKLLNGSVARVSRLSAYYGAFKGMASKKVIISGLN